jgi:hypothetical protein
MAATAGSVYQVIRTKHIANNPPNAQPQQDNETNLQYFNRMFAQGLNPDIDADESDADYLIRLATYFAVINPPLAYALTAGSATTATTATTATSASFATTASYASLVHSASIVTP